MPKTREKYLIAGVDVYHVRNRNELRVAKCLEQHISDKGLDDIAPELVRDAFALALNKLQPRYTQQGTIVLRDPVTQEAVEEIVTQSLLHVMKNPKD